MAKLAPIPQRAFDAWITPSTWYTGSDQDLARFHAFVWAVIRYSRRPPSESEVKAMIRERWEGKLHDLDDFAHRASTLYMSLYDFGKARNAPGVAPRIVEDYLFEMRAQD